MLRHACMTRSILRPRTADNGRQEVTKKIINNNLFLIKTNNLVIEIYFLNIVIEIFIYYK
jgi:hypothetical protein